MRPRAVLGLSLGLLLAACAGGADLSGMWSPVYDDPGVFGGSGDQRMSALADFGGDLLAVGYDTADGDADAIVWRSRDGMVWDRIPHDEVVFGGDGDQMMGGVAVIDGGVIVVGSDTSGGDQDAAVWTSPDGLSWSRVQPDESVFGGDGDQAMWAVTAGGPGVIAVGLDGSGGDSDAAAWTSPDGVEWSRVAHDEVVFGGTGDQWAVDVVAGVLGVIAVGSDRTAGYGDAAVWRSDDGSSWVRVPNQDEVFGAFGDEAMWGVALGGPGVVAVGWAWYSMEQYRAAVWTSPDGVTWTQVPDGPMLRGSVPKAAFMHAVASSDAGFVAVGNESSLGLESDPAVWTSPDGVIWTRFADPGGKLADPGAQGMAAVVIGPDGMVAVGWQGVPGYVETDARVWMVPRK